MKTAIVVSYPTDNHGKVIEQINSLGFRGVLWDLSEYPSKSEFSFSVLPNKKAGTVLQVGEKNIPKGKLGWHILEASKWRFPQSKKSWAKRIR